LHRAVGEPPRKESVGQLRRLPHDVRGDEHWPRRPERPPRPAPARPGSAAEGRFAGPLARRGTRCRSAATSSI
jgi:hypothetical protein